MYVGDLVKDKYSSFSGVVLSRSETGLLKIVSTVPGENTRLKYLQEESTLPAGTPYKGSVVRTSLGHGTLEFFRGNDAVVLLDSGYRVTVQFTEMVVNIFDNEYVDNVYIDLYMVQ